MEKEATQVRSSNLPPIPLKQFFTISEVSDLCDVKPHVLRYWEQEFESLSPVKKSGNRRHYQQDDIVVIRKIRELLYNQGFTINGARSKLEGEQQEEQPSVVVQPSKQRSVLSLEDHIKALQDVVELLA